MARISLEQLLERCLQELTRTGDVEVSLRYHPEYAGELRPLLEMAQATRRYYEAVPEAPGGLVAGREQLLAVAAQQRAMGGWATSAARTATGRPAGRKTRLMFGARLIAVLLVVVGTAALGGGVIWAAGDSVPGDLLHPVKLATEDVRLAFTSAPADQIDLALQFVEERTEEMQTLAAAGRQVPGEIVARMERHIECALTQAAWASDEEVTDLLTRIAERTRIQEQVLERAQVTAPQQAQAGLERAVTVCRQGVEAAEDGLRDPQAFRRRYRYQRGTWGPTDEPGQVTVTAGGDQEQDQDQERYQQQDQERECTPVGTPHVAPQGPQTTPVPRATPHGPQTTPVPQVTPQGPQRTPVRPAATPRPQDPGDGGTGGHGDGGRMTNEQ
jgi:hypothetical protein